jgi:hypothetical protein
MRTFFKKRCTAASGYHNVRRGLETYFLPCYNIP